jgi:hypothetical protein
MSWQIAALFTLMSVLSVFYDGLNYFDRQSTDGSSFDEIMHRELVGLFGAQKEIFKGATVLGNHD